MEAIWKKDYSQYMNILNEIDYSISFGRDFTNMNIHNVEAFNHLKPQIQTPQNQNEPTDVKKLIHEPARLTQTEKFYRRFGDALKR